MNGDSRVRVTSGPRASLLESRAIVGHVHFSTRLLEAFSVPTSRGGRGGETRLRGERCDAVTLSPLAAPPDPRGYSIRGIGGFPVSPKKGEALQFSYLSEEGKKQALAVEVYVCRLSKTGEAK
jgi:hypothetical protein